MTKYEVLLCIYYYLDSQYDKTKSEEYVYYLSNINPTIWGGGVGTADPAYYEYYLKICESFFPEDECSLADGLQYAMKYLEAYNLIEHTEFSYNIDEVVKVFKKCDFSKWEQIYHWVKTKGK